MITANFTVAPLTGDVYGTEFKVTNLTTTTNTKVDRLVWNFGTKDFYYNVQSPSYIYKHPGIYTISLSAIDFDNNISTATQQITADLPYRDYITFTQIPETFPDPGKTTKTPFQVKVLTTNFKTPIYVDLFATNSNSTPLQFVAKKWNFLNPTWKFLDKNLNTVTSLSVVPTYIYKNNKVVAASGTAEFYYVDSMSTGNPVENCPILITATLQTSGFSNSKDSHIYDYNSYANTTTLQASILWQVNDLFPNLLKVSGNYVDDINTKQWVGIKIPVLVTCHSQQSLLLPGGEDTPSEAIFSYPQNNALGKISPVQLTVTNLNSNQYVIEDEPLYFQSKDKYDNRIGGYIFTTVTVLTAAKNIAITANATTYIDKDVSNETKFVYPYGYGITPAVWVSNPVKNTLNKITLIPYPNNCNTLNILKQNKVLLDGLIKEVEVPSLSTSDTYNYSMSGFSGIYSISIDPRNNDVIACDSELDRIYRISTTGDILKTYSLSSLEGYNPNQKFFQNWSWKTPSPTISSTRYAFYGPYLINNLPQNYFTTINGRLVKPGIVQVNEYDRFIRFLSLPYPPENLPVETIQFLNPSLPSKYIDNLQVWEFNVENTTTAFYLSGTSPLSNNSDRFLVSVDGLIKLPTEYTVSPTLRTITFSQPVSTNSSCCIFFTPNIGRSSWTFTTTRPTSSFSFANQRQYFSVDPNTGFLVVVNGEIKPQYTFKHIPEQKTLLFTPPLTGSNTVFIGQFYVPEQINNTIAYTPTYASIDNDYNIWVSLFNSVSVLKFDENLNFLFSVAPSGLQWMHRAWINNPTDIGYQAGQFSYDTRYTNPTGETPDFYTDEFFLKPPVVETDKDSNCWATYANPLCCLLVKYSNTGSILSQIPLSPYTTPINITVTPNNNIWVANFNGSVYENSIVAGSLQLYDTTTSTLLSTVTGFARPGHISLDRDNNIWFTHGINKIGYIDTRTGVLSTWVLELTGGFTQYAISSAVILSGSESVDFEENEEDDYIGGLAVDVYNRVWVIDGLQNYAWVLSATPNFNNSPMRLFKIRPNAAIGYYVDLNTAETTVSGERDYYYRSAQATGDWTGNRWYQKYSQTPKLSALAVSGVSVNIDVDEFVNRNQIRRINESFDTSSYYKSLALPENLNTNSILFNKFFAAAVGTSLLSANEDLGQIVYERIANFSANHSDIDTCNIKQLLSMAEETAAAAADYAADYPTDIRNLIDIVSIPRAKLWGLKDNIPIIRKSFGRPLNTETAILTAGTKILLRNKLDGTTSLVPIPITSNGLSAYPLSAFEGFGFVQPVMSNYIFYEFVPKYSGEYIENVIDWDSPITTLEPTLSTAEKWVGAGAAVETAFRYALTKNLFT